MSVRRLISSYRTIWMLRAHRQQRLAWKDAEQARVARDRAEAQAAAQSQAMLCTNPSGSLGRAELDSVGALKKAGLL